MIVKKYLFNKLLIMYCDNYRGFPCTGEHDASPFLRPVIHSPHPILTSVVCFPSNLGGMLHLQGRHEARGSVITIVITIVVEYVVVRFNVPSSKSKNGMFRYMFWTCRSSFRYQLKGCADEYRGLWTKFMVDAQHLRR